MSAIQRTSRYGSNGPTPNSHKLSEKQQRAIDQLTTRSGDTTQWRRSDALKMPNLELQEVIHEPKWKANIRKVISSARYQLLSLLVISMNTIVSILETVDSFHESAGDDFFAYVDAICVFLFTLDMCLLLFLSTQRLKAVFHPMFIIDVAAVMPFYIELVVSASGSDISDTLNLSWLRMVRLFRFLRVLKVSSHSVGVQIFIGALVTSIPQLCAMAAFSSIAAVLFASVIYHLEVDDPDTTFDNIPNAVYWCFTTFTTVGYGDYAASTPLGKLLSIIAMCTGIVIFALPITVIGGNYEAMVNDALGNRTQLEINNVIVTARQMAHQQHLPGVSGKILAECLDLKKFRPKTVGGDPTHSQDVAKQIELIFATFDTDQNGYLDDNELKELINALVFSIEEEKFKSGLTGDMVRLEMRLASKIDTRHQEQMIILQHLLDEQNNNRQLLMALLNQNAQDSECISPTESTRNATKGRQDMVMSFSTSRKKPL